MKASEGSKPWQDMTTYGTSSASRASVSELSPRERSPALKSPLQSVVVRRRSPRPSPLQKSSPPLSSPTQLSSALQSSSTSFQAGSHQSPFDHGSASLSPTRKSPVCKSPTPIGSIYGTSQKEETAAPAGGGAFSKRQVTHSVRWGAVVEPAPLCGCSPQAARGVWGWAGSCGKEALWPLCLQAARAAAL